MGSGTRTPENAGGGTAPAFLALGAWAVLAQSLFLRESLAVFFGNEISLGLTLAAWFLGIFAGAGAGSFSPLGGRGRLTPFVVPFLLLLVLLPVSLAGFRACRLFLGIPGGELVPFTRMLLVCLLAVSPCSFLVGLLFPAASSLGTGASGSPTTVIGRVYVLESLGSLAGGALFSLLLLPRVPALTAVAIFAACALGALALLLRTRGRRGPALALALLALLVAGSVPLGAASALDSWTVRTRWRSYRNGYPLLLSRDSPYQNIVVAGTAPLHLFENGQIVASFPDEYGNSARVHPLLLEHPRPRAVLLLGGGITGALREVLRHPVERVHVVESDPWLVDSVRPFLPEEDRRALADPRVTLIAMDPRRFVLRGRDGGREGYDLVLMNFPDPASAFLNRYYTREFFEECRALLAPGGVVVTRISSSSNYLAGAALGLDASVYWTLRDVFRVVLATPGEENFLIASDDPSAPTLDPEVLKARLRERGAVLPLFFPEQLDLLLPPDRVSFTRELLEQARDTPRNTDLRPVSYFYGLLLWDRFSGGRFAYSLSALAKARPLPVLGASSLLLAAWAGAVLLRRGEGRRRLQALTAIATTGFASITWSLLLLLAFQDLFGNLYLEVALLVAVFMLGLALGAEGMRRCAGDGRRERLLVISTDAAIAIFSLLVVPAIALWTRAGPGPVAWAGFAGLLLLAGALTGAQFPVASGLYFRGAGGPDAEFRRAAGRVDSADHLGAMAGAFLTGIVLVPLTGLVGAAVAVTLAKVASLVSLARPVRG